MAGSARRRAGAPGSGRRRGRRRYFRIANDSQDLVSKRDGVVCVHQNAVDAISNDLGYTADARTNDRLTVIGRLEQHQTERLGP